MNSTGQAGFVSLLDLMCCGFGGALLIVLIVLSAEPERKDNGLVVVRFKRQGAGPRAELGIKYRGPADREWRRARPTPLAGGRTAPATGATSPSGPSVATFFSARSEGESGSEACLVLVQPEPGVWEFRPYLVDYPAGVSPQPVLVGWEVLGQALDGPPEVVEPGRPLRHPGHDEGPLVRAGIRAVASDGE